MFFVFFSIQLIYLPADWKFQKQNFQRFADCQVVQEFSCLNNFISTQSQPLGKYTFADELGRNVPGIQGSNKFLLIRPELAFKILVKHNFLFSVNNNIKVMCFNYFLCKLSM
jgi:hypothetical protein